jgi:hypothetical protein
VLIRRENEAAFLTVDVCVNLRRPVPFTGKSARVAIPPKRTALR